MCDVVGANSTMERSWDGDLDGYVSGWDMAATELGELSTITGAASIAINPFGYVSLGLGLGKSGAEYYEARNTDKDYSEATVTGINNISGFLFGLLSKKNAFGFATGIILDSDFFRKSEEDFVGKIFFKNQINRNNMEKQQ